MQKELANHIIKTLQADFRANFDKTELARIKDRMLAESDKAGEAAFEILSRGRTTGLYKSLPSAWALLGIVEAEGKRLRLAEAESREEDWKKEKGVDRSGRVEHQTFLSRPQQTELARDAVLLIRGILSGQLSDQDKYDGAVIMARKYPGIGYEKEVIRLQKAPG